MSYHGESGPPGHRGLPGGINLHVYIDTSEMNEVTRKAERLNVLLEEASSLMNELASKEIKLSVNI